MLLALGGALAAAARIPMMTPTLDAVDAELATWRDRLGAASRNVSELSELPEYAVARQVAGRNGPGRGGGARAGRHDGRAVAGGAADRRGAGPGGGGAHPRLARVAGARRRRRRRWRSCTARRCSVDLSDTPVLHRRLLAGPRATAAVSPGDAAADDGGRVRPRPRAAGAHHRGRRARGRVAGASDGDGAGRAARGAAGRRRPARPAGPSGGARGVASRGRVGRCGVGGGPGGAGGRRLGGGVAG